MYAICKIGIRYYSIKCSLSSRAALTMANSHFSNPKQINVKEPEVCLNHVRDSVPRIVEPELVEVIRRFDDFCYYTGPNRELYPSLVLIDSYKIFEDPNNLTPENLKLASILAWCFENATTSMLVNDDIMDEQGVRWKKKCWHLRSHIGLTALVDAKQLTVSSYFLMKKYFKKHPFYVDFVNLLAESLQRTVFGQSADVSSSEQFKRNRNIQFLSKQTYISNVIYKSAYSIYKIPVLAAMRFANVTKSNSFNLIADVLLMLAIYRQAQNDMWDVFGKYETIGKYGTDLVKGRCTWLTATVAEHGTDQQKALFCKNYGKENAKCQNTIIGLFADLGMIEKFLQYKENLITDLHKKMDDVVDPKMKRLVKLFIENYVDVDENLKV
ncbi:hypothetical protein FQA39_LY05610 [Lamprigera yunnana]|nr:hypothetical protein FQA39_LY05610 [Lamprigera yunnana]